MPEVLSHRAYTLAESCTRDADAVERHDETSLAELMCRVAVEYAEMPGLCLTVAQACRLFGARKDRCGWVLDELVKRGVLKRNSDGLFLSNGPPL